MNNYHFDINFTINININHWYSVFKFSINCSRPFPFFKNYCRGLAAGAADLSTTKTFTLKKQCTENVHRKIQRIQERLLGALGIPGWRPASPWHLHWASRAALRVGFQTLPQIHEKKNELWAASVTSWEAPGDPEGIQKSTKDRFCMPKRRSKRDFLTIFVKVTVCTFCAWSGIDFSLKKRCKKWWKNTCMFLQHRLFFWTRRPSRNMVFYDTKATFSFFVFLIFSQRTLKNGFKIQDTFSPLKNTKTLTRGTRFGFQNGPELTSENAKVHKIPQKSRSVDVAV